MRFATTGNTPVILSMPAWTPGAYEISNFARYVSSFAAVAGTAALDWDKSDHDTWRIHGANGRRVTVTFDVLADTLDNAMAWARPDFAMFNGTTVFLYPEGRGFNFAATVRVEAPAGTVVGDAVDVTLIAPELVEDPPVVGGHPLLHLVEPRQGGGFRVRLRARAHRQRHDDHDVKELLHGP